MRRFLPLLVVTCLGFAPAPFPKPSAVGNADQLVRRLRAGKPIVTADGWEIKATSVAGRKLVKPMLRRQAGGIVIVADDAEVLDGPKKGEMTLRLGNGCGSDARTGSTATWMLRDLVIAGMR
jgi:hypothetical protein